MNQKKKEIRNFLIVIGAGVFTALLLVLWLVKQEPWEQEVTLEEALLSPTTIETMSNRSVKGASGYVAKFLIESIDLSYFDAKKKKWEMMTIDIAPYEALFAELQGDRGVLEPPQEVVELFQDPHLATLSIYVRSQEPQQTQATTGLFQEVQFLSSGNWYRVQLHQESAKKKWFYFEHDEVLASVMEAIRRP